MEKKKKYLLVIGIFIVLLSVVGLTYAYWTITLAQDGENVVYTDCLNIEFSGTNDITLNNAYPMTESELETDFFPNQTPYHFTIENKCSSEVPISINLESLSTQGTNLKDDYVDVILWSSETSNKFQPETDTVLSHKGSGVESKYRLIDNTVNESMIADQAKAAYQIYKFKLPGKKEGSTDHIKEFNLLLFMDYATPISTTDNVTNNATWKGKITLNNYEPVPNTLRKINTYDVEDTLMIDKNGMWKYANQITKIVFQDTMSPPDKYVYEFDESADQNGTVKSYLVENGEKKVYDDCESECKMETAYIAYIQADGDITANSNSSYLFAGFEWVENIEGLNYLDTSNVTDMSYMFDYMEKLQTLTLEDKFNTSNVTNMEGMFAGMFQLTELDLSQAYFDTSQVTDMSAMFSLMFKLQTLTLGDKFNTGNVTDMSAMFNRMTSLTHLDLSSFDTRKVGSVATEYGWNGSFNNMFNADTLLTDITYGDNFVRMNDASVNNMFGEGSSAPKPPGETWQGLFD